MAGGREIALPKDRVVDGDYIALGESVTLSGTVSGDAFLVGESVVVEGEVLGDLLVAGGVVDLKGRVAEDARIAGGEVQVSGEIGKNLTVAGGSVNLSDSARVGGSLVAGGGSVLVFAPVGRDAIVGASRATLGGAVGGDVKLVAGGLRLTSGARVAGDLMYWSRSEIEIQAGAQVLGETLRKELPAIPWREGVKPIAKVAGGVFIAFLAGGVVSFLIVGLIVLRVYPVFAQRTVEVVVTRPWASLGLGFLAAILFPLVSAILLSTVIGVPLGFLLLALFLLYLYFAYLFASLVIGRQLLKPFGVKRLSGWVLLVGLIALGVMTAIPVVGWLVVALVLFSGLGALLLAKRSYYRELRAQGVI